MTPGCVKHVRSVLVWLSSAAGLTEEDVVSSLTLSPVSLRFRYAVAYSGTSGASFYTTQTNNLVTASRFEEVNSP